MDANTDDDDDDDDDCYDDATSSNGSCHCFHCRAGRIRAVPWANGSLYDCGDDEDYEDDEDNEYEDHEEYDDYYDENDDEQDDSQSENDSCDGDERCAVCFGRPKKETNPLAWLPCCGKDGREETSSTRFCTICLNKCLIWYPPLLPNNGVLDRTRIGECPRCRTLIVTRGTARQGTFANADFRETIMFAMAKPNIRPILVLAAFAPDPRWIPVELFNDLGFDLEHGFRMLSQWNIWKNKSNGIYSIEPLKQQELKIYMAEDMADYTDEKTLLWVISKKLFLAGVTSVLNFELYKALRIFHHCIFLLLRVIGGLPAIDFLDLPWWQEWLLIALNLFLVGITSAMLLVFVVYGAISFMAVMIVRWAISSPKIARCAILGLLVFFAYRTISWEATYGDLGY
jgi:hypothetical protein